ncbi:ankyrin repeat domain-containing protein [Candidatus Dependentiae bacterium]
MEKKRMGKKRVVLSIIMLCLLASFSTSKSMDVPTGSCNVLIKKIIKGVRGACRTINQLIQEGRSHKIRKTAWNKIEGLFKKHCNHKDKNKATKYDMFYWACENGHVNTVKEFLKHKGIKDIDINQRNIYRENLFHRVCARGYSDIMKELLKQDNIDVNKVGRNGTTPLWIACHRDNLDIVKELLKHPKIDVNTANKPGEVPIYRDVNIDDTPSEPPLYAACKRRHLDIAKELLSHPNIEVNKTDKNGKTLLLNVCFYGYLQIVKELLKHPKIDVNKASKSGYYEGYTPLFLACRMGNLQIMKELLKKKNINVNKALKSGKYKGLTPLGWACRKGRLNIVKGLLRDKKININKTSKYCGLSRSPLSLAEKHLNIVRLLVENGAQIGKSKLKKKYLEFVKTLLSKVYIGAAQSHDFELKLKHFVYSYKYPLRILKNKTYRDCIVKTYT